ncbi:MAG: RNA polymerase sigma factor SigJ [Pseudomonadota bacterium]
MIDPKDAQSVEDLRPRLIGLAYRMLGSVADAEDAVQDTLLKWSQIDSASIDNPGGWLTTACTRRCIDMLRSAHRARVDYVGAWLPEPMQTSSDNPQAESDLDLAGSLTTAFLLMLERLTARERAAYVLHDVFETPYAEIAQMLNIKETACRQLVSRARRHVGRDKIRAAAPAARQDELLKAFRSALATGATDGLAHLLADDVRLSADGGGKVPAILNAVQGKTEVIDFVATALKRYWERLECAEREINGARGLVVGEKNSVHATVSFSFDENGKANGIFIMRNPDKLSRFAAMTLQ